MPYTSADISGMIGGQMAMFSNQAAYSQQVGGMVGTSPMGMAGGGGMTNPFPQPHMGSQIAGGVAMGMGGAATGASIAGGLMGGAAGWMDPFTSGIRGFGMGSGGGLGAVGSAFAQGGARAGMGALAGGVGGAAVAALPAAAVGMAASYAGGQMYQGVQNIEDVRAMSGHFGTQYGQAGSAMGGGMGHQTIKKITGALHELVGEDMRTTMEEIKQVMDAAGRMGMLTGITDAQTFKQKFGGIVKQVRQVADIMGTTLSEAAPVLSQMGQMGLWSSADVMGTAISGRVAGGAAPQMMGAMQRGAQVSHAMGGTMRSGAMMGRETFMDIQAAQRAGVLTGQDVMEYTGGVGGAKGQQMMASSIQGIMSRFGQSSAGRLMMAGLGQRGEGGEFTGQIDPERLQDFMSGGISVGGLQKLGQRGLSGANAATFMDVQEELAQNLGAQGGIGAMGKITEQVLGKMGGEPKLRQQLMRQMLGVSNREAKLLGKLMDEMPRIRDEQSRAAEDAINQAFEELERRQYRSWEGLKGAVANSWREGVSRPLQEAGERLAADFGETLDRGVSALTGQTRRIPMGTQERARLIRGGALTEDFAGMEGMGQEFAAGAPLENLIRGIQAEGVGEMGYGTLAGTAIGGAIAGPVGMAAGAAVGGAIGAYTTGLTSEGLTQKQAALGRLGIKPGASRSEMARGIQMASMRASGASREAFRFSKDDQAIRNMKDKLNAAYGKSENLRKLKKENPRGFGAALLREMGYDVTPDNLNRLSVVQQEENVGGGSLAVDYKQEASEVVNFPESPKELVDAQNAAIEEMYQLSGGKNITEAGTKGAAVGAAIGTVVLPVIGTAVGAALGGALELTRAAIEDTGIEREDLERAMTGEGSDVMHRYLRGTLTKKEAIKRLQRVRGGEGIERIIETVDRDKLSSYADEFTKFRKAQVGIEGRARISTMAERTREDVKLPGEMAEERAGAFADLVRSYRGKGGAIPDVLEASELKAAQLEAQSFAKKLTRGQAEELAKTGAVGRQVAALFEVSEASKGEMAGAGASQDMLKRLKRMGFGIEQVGGEEGERLRQLAKGGIKKDEAKEFGELASKSFKNMFSELAEARETHNEKMQRLLNINIEANTKFVRAVGEVLGDDLKDNKSTAASSETSQQFELLSPSTWF